MIDQVEVRYVSIEESQKTFHDARNVIQLDLCTIFTDEKLALRPRSDSKPVI
jgi:hypothetical protein